MRGPSQAIGTAVLLAALSLAEAPASAQEELAAPAATEQEQPCERAGMRCVHSGPHRALWLVTAEALTIQVGSLFLLAVLPPDTTQWGPGSFWNIWENLGEGLHFDTDAWYWNYVGHPLAGSEYYLLARNRGISWLGALGYAFLMSGFWEVVTEGFFEQSSVQDLVITPLGGATLGELRWQIVQALMDPATGEPRSVWALVLLLIVDPFDAIFRGIDSLVEE